MKKLICILTVALLIASFALRTSATTFNWYCQRKSNNQTPSCPPEYLFIRDYGGYDCDTRHTDYTEKEKVIYLTFDAGYENGNIEKTLDILKENNVTAAFFILGNLINKSPSLVQRMINDGHLVCNHTYSHKDMSKASESEFVAELKRLEASCIEKINEEPAKFYRPPEGKFSPQNIEWAKKQGYKTVFWSFAYADWDNAKQPSPESAKKKIIDNLHNGEIMLLHPTSDTNCMILDEVIKYAIGEGFRFASLTELE